MNLSDHHPPFISFYRIYRNAALISVLKGGGLHEYYDKGIDKKKVTTGTTTGGLIRYRVEAFNLRNEVVAFID